MMGAEAEAEEEAEAELAGGAEVARRARLLEPSAGEDITGHVGGMIRAEGGDETARAGGGVWVWS